MPASIPSTARDDAVSRTMPVEAADDSAGVRPHRLSISVSLGLSLLSAVLLILAFPNFELWALVWIAPAVLLFIIARSSPGRSFLCGWLAGSVFYFGSCYWLTYSMTRYGGVPLALAYFLLVPPSLLLGVFVGGFALVLARLIRVWGPVALLTAPLLSTAQDWLRLTITGQLWNAIGYSLAYHPALIQSARWGGVYAVGFLIISVNAALALLFIERNRRAMILSASMIAVVTGIILVANTTQRATMRPIGSESRAGLEVIAIQPNVPMDPDKSPAQFQELMARHLTMSEAALDRVRSDGLNKLVVWPESPMNFTYGEDPLLRQQVANFVSHNQTALLFNSQEQAPDGWYNSALMVNEAGRLIGQYDKIRLMPFGEYVPLPRWLPGSNRVRAIVGGFTPGSRYTLMPVGNERVGVFICIESAYPWIARRLTAAGAGMLVNVSNDGYLGATAVMRQHLANAIFRAVENQRPLLRVTNTGITAYISPRGEVQDATPGFQQATRIWRIFPSTEEGGYGRTFYTSHGDLFALACLVVSGIFILLSFRSARRIY